MKILVVEDSQIVRAAYTTLLRSENHEVDFAEDGLKALKMVKNKYDVILMDINLPHINGIDVARELRRQKKAGNPVIIGVTSETGEDTLKMCLEAGMNEVLQKPITSEQILETLAKYFSTRRKNKVCLSSAD